MAVTAGQLENILARYVPGDADFYDYLNMVGPRLHALGNWRDLTHEMQISTDHAYYTIPRGFESVIAGVVDDLPVRGSSQWQDYKTTGMLGTSKGPPPVYGMVDDGMRPTYIELQDGDATEEGDYNLALVPTSPRTALPTQGSVYVDYEDAAGDNQTHEFDLGGEPSLATTWASGFGAVKILQILFQDVPDVLSVQAIPVSDGTTFEVAEGRGDEITRFRRFRLANEAKDTRTVVLLLKREFMFIQDAYDQVYLSDININKHGILAVVAEDNSDLEAAEYHWSVCSNLLENEMHAYRGAIKPRIKLDPTGDSGPPTLNIV